MTVRVESAIKLDREQTSELQTLLSKKLGAGTECVFVVNPEILGGLRVTVGSKRYDLSLSGRLNQIRSAITA